MFMLNSGAVVLKEYTRFTTTGMKRNSICIAEAKKKKKNCKTYDFVFVKNMNYEYIII